MEFIRVRENLKNIYFAIYMPILYSILNLIFHIVLSIAMPYYDKDIMFYETIFCIIFLSISVPKFLRVQREISKEEGFLKQLKLDFKYLIFLIIITFGLIGIIDIMFRIMGDVPIIKESLESLNEFFDSGESYIWVFLNVAFLGPIVEEIIFRGITFNYIEKLSNHKVAIVLSAIFFALWHLSIIQIVYVPVMGIILAFVYYYSGKNILFPIIIHILNNFIAQLPEGWNTELVNLIITKAGYILLVPMLFILFEMYRKYREF